MRLFSLHALLVICILLKLPQSFSQGINGFNQSASYLAAYFREENLIIQPETSFFNVLIIENRGERTEDIEVEINVPLGWEVMRLESRTHQINPGDSIILPIRVAPTRSVEGEIGYSVIAAINSRTGETLTNAYCFIKIPRQSNLRFRPISRVSYFDQQTGETKFSFLLQNHGNISELIYLNFRSTENISIIGERDNIFNLDVRVPARTDTTITLPVVRQENITSGNGSLFRVDLQGYTEETRFSSSFWFNHLSNHYKYRIPESEKILIAEIAAQNLLSDQKAYLNGGIRGNILFPENRNLNYSFYKYGTSTDLYRYSRVRLEYVSPNLMAAMGDIYNFPVKYGFGKGVEMSIPFMNHYRINALAGRNPFRPIDNYGFIFEESRTPMRFRTRYSYTDNMHFNSLAHTLALRTSLNIGSGHNMRMEIGASDVLYKDISQNNRGYSINADYTGRINNTLIRLRENFSTTGYYGSLSGRHDFMANISRPLNENTQLNFFLYDRSYKPSIETREGIQSDRFTKNSESRAIFSHYLSRNFSVLGGPVYQRKSTNSFFLFDGINPFTSHSAKIQAGIRVRDAFGFTFNPSATAGYTFITNYTSPSAEEFPAGLEGRSRNYFTSNVNINIRSETWGGFINYFYGPYSVNQEISKFYYNIDAHSIRLMPYIERFLYRDIVKLSSKLGILYDFSFKTNRLNLSNQLDLFLKNDLTLSVLNTYSYQRTTDMITEDKYTYTNSYFELRLSKEFNWNQPRLKYYDLTISLFKDINGNLRREANEPGIKDILVHITSIESHEYEEYGTDYQPAGNMVSHRLLSGMEGTITYENIPRGLYKILLENIGSDQDKFFPDHNEFIINVADDKTVYVPYLERNRIFGRVVMNRSQLSNLGPIQVSNLRVTATDSRDRTTSTLTDANGYFEMYVPSVDSYVVSISNIFQEHFNLRQNNFRANLNGFKQFEVNFVFDEIRRQIEFTPSPSELEAEIRRVGRTNLAGNVRDASTLQGLRAQVEIINNENSSIVERTYTERSTGRYNTSFITYDNYSLIVTAPGYWMHSERLALDPFLTIQDVERDVLLENIVLGASFQLNNLIFTSGSSEIPNEALPELDRLIIQLRDNPSVRIRIVGHSDASETLDDRDLSARRAEMVMRYMVQNGFSNIEFTGLEASQPIAPNDTEDNRRRNRRVEIIIVDK